LRAFSSAPSNSSIASSLCCRRRQRLLTGGGLRFSLAQPPRGGLTAADPSTCRTIRLADLHDIDDQKARIDANTRQFVAGLPANNVLLTGARGSGKSSLIKALLNEYAPSGPARDRGREGRPDRPARHRRSDRRASGAFHHLLRRPLVRIRRRALQGAEGVLDGSLAARPRTS
jgi:hypothetical protein